MLHLDRAVLRFALAGRHGVLLRVLLEFALTALTTKVMVTDERNCIDIANQTSAVIAALRRVQGDMLRDHLTAIAAAVVKGDLSETERRRLADEVGKVTTRLG